MNNDTVRVVAIIVAALILIGLIYYYYINVPKKHEHFSVIQDESNTPSRTQSTQRSAPNVQSYSTRGPSPYEPMPLEPSANEYHLPPPVTATSTPYYKSPDCPKFPQDRIEPSDLLPKNAANTKWAQANPAGQGDVRDINLLNAAFHLGMNTQGQSMRNASHDLRSEPSNPRYKVSIWNNATIESDLNRRPLE